MSRDGNVDHTDYLIEGVELPTFSLAIFFRAQPLMQSDRILHDNNQYVRPILK